MVYKSKDEYMGNWLDGKNMAKEYIYGVIIACIQANLKIIKWMAMEYVMIAMEI